MSAFSKLIEELAAATGIDAAADAADTCTLVADDLAMTLQYVPERDEVVLFSPVWQPEAEGTPPPPSVLHAALELAYDGQETAGAFLGLFRDALILSVHLPMAALDAAALAVRLTAFADAAAGAAATLAAADAAGAGTPPPPAAPPPPEEALLRV